ncbi:MAG TPA: MFS transporter [Burkholderiales bacterium]
MRFPSFSPVAAPAEAQHLKHLVLAATSISYIVVILDTSIVNVALQRVGSSLGTGVAGLQWIVNAYTLVFASLLLSGGALGDRFAARWVYFTGLALFTFASVCCGLAPGLGSLVAARALQGAGAALLVPCSLKLLSQAYPDDGERAGAIGVWAGWGGTALAGGPLAGGVLIDMFGWRSIFLVNLPIGLLGLWLTLRIPLAEAGKGGATARRLDLSGQVAAIVALAALVAVLIEGPQAGWGAPAILGGALLSVAAGTAFIAIEARRAAPMLPLDMFRNPAFSAAALVALVGTLTVFGLIFVFSLYFQQQRGYSPLVTGLAFLPLTAVVTAGNMVSGRLTRACGAFWPVLGGLLCCAAGFAGMLPAGEHTPYWLLALPMLAIGLGGGLLTPAATAALMAAADRSRAGIASGVLNTARQIGAALGVALFGAMLAGLHPFMDGMRAALASATVLALAAALVWRTGMRRHA